MKLDYNPTPGKRCPCCNQIKDLSHFCLRHGKPNTYCKECAAAKARAYRQRTMPELVHN